MKNLVLGFGILMVLGYAYENVNDIVGKVIDKDEAKYFRIFQDITDFVSARFFFSGESVVVEMNTGSENKRVTTYRTISMKSLIALDKYIEHFQSVIENVQFRREFVKVYDPAWPLITDAEIARMVKEENYQVKENRILCAVAGSSAVANFAGCISREEVHPPGDCSPPTLRIIPEIYCPVTASGFALSSLLSQAFYKSQPYDKLLKKDIMAFDSAGVPVTAAEVRLESDRFSSCVAGGCVSGFSIILTASTASVLAFSVIAFDWDTELSFAAVSVPIITLSISEFIILNKVFRRYLEAGREKEAIQKIIEQRRAQEKQREKQEEE